MGVSKHVCGSSGAENSNSNAHNGQAGNMIHKAERAVGKGGDCGERAHTALCEGAASRQSPLLQHRPEFLISQSPQTTSVNDISPNLKLYVDYTKHIYKSEPAPGTPISDPDLAHLCLLQGYRARPFAEFQANIFHSASSWLLLTCSFFFLASDCVNFSHSKQNQLC